MKRFELLLFAVAAILNGCGNHSCLDEVLDSAGSNRSELVAVLNHYHLVNENLNRLFATKCLR